MTNIQAIKNLVSEELQQVNHYIRQEIQFQHPLVENMTAHLLSGGGKQLRPLIVLLACKACAYQGKDNIKLASMLEFFHSATLLHDDVIDESKLRRGQETAHQIWGNKASVLVGDYLFTLHTKILIEIENIAILRMMTDTANQIGYGEIKQLMNRQQIIDEAEYFEVIQAKTSLLFAVSAAIAGLISGQAPKTVDMLYQYGLHLGNAFQLIDDALDYCSSSEVMGKNVGDDLADGKMTLPLIYAFEHANPTQKEIILATINQANIDNLPQILNSIQETNAIAYTQDIAKQQVMLGKNALKDFPESAFKQALLELLDLSIERQN